MHSFVYGDTIYRITNRNITLTLLVQLSLEDELPKCNKKKGRHSSRNGGYAIVTKMSGIS